MLEKGGRHIVIWSRPASLVHVETEQDNRYNVVAVVGQFADSA